MRTFHHIGLPTDQKQEGEKWVAETRVWVSDPRKHPQTIEFLRFEPDSPVSGPLRDLPHVAFRVDSLTDELAEARAQGAAVLLEPFNPSKGCTVVFLMLDGCMYEFMEYGDDRDLPWEQ